MLMPLTLKISNSYDIINTRMRVREAARDLGMDLGDQARISLATSSLMEGLKIGQDTKYTSIAIEQLNGGPKPGLKISCKFPVSGEHKSVETAASNISWMVDEITVQYLQDEQAEITLTKWVVRR
jgi:hypothetical protein